jgi:hypothetical protein
LPGLNEQLDPTKPEFARIEGALEGEGLDAVEIKTP